MNPGTRDALIQAIRADVRARVTRILDRFERELHAADAAERDAVVRQALVDMSVALTDGLHAQLRELRLGGTLGDRT